MQTFGEIARHTLRRARDDAECCWPGEEDFTVPDFRQRLARHIEELPTDARPAEVAARAQGIPGAAVGGAGRAVARFLWRRRSRGSTASG